MPRRATIFPSTFDLRALKVLKECPRTTAWGVARLLGKPDTILYRELDRLRRMNYVEFEQGRTNKKLYSLTAKGQDLLTFLETHHNGEI